ncbi:tripartite tricarboxylate transporter TctB family protein [Thermoactinospora rubra]|uniref:tripartite tricarboxylate transporter TctB family protein n=1 Tax=Thermoactinospora rubra TaxID=1088767 RepID=UPI000A10FB7E|nr:tripartite tricarboxylate transporter TctB family protein [Thermoactinospora rubra]
MSSPAPSPQIPAPRSDGRGTGGGEGRRRWRPELVLALAVLALGVFVIVGTLEVTAAASRLGVGPRFFPMLVGGSMVVIGVFYVADVLRGGHGDPEESEDVDTHAPADWRSVLLVSGIFLGFVAILNWLGWVLSASLLFFALSVALGARHLVRTAVIAVVLGVSTYLVFVKGLGVTLPNGILSGVM